MREVRAIRDVPKQVWITKILCYLKIDECLKLSQVCQFFNTIIRSPMFIKHNQKLTEHTKIDVTPSHFGSQGVVKTQEGYQAQIEILTNMKTFLLEQVKQSEQKSETNMKDILTMKEKISVQMNLNEKQYKAIKDREVELKQVRE